MKHVLLGMAIALAVATMLFPGRTARTEAVRTDAVPFAVPTFHCLGLYWSPPGGAADREVLVRYRRQGASQWKDGLSLRYNPIPGTDEDRTDYRGSVVSLTPGTTY